MTTVRLNSVRHNKKLRILQFRKNTDRSVMSHHRSDARQYRTFSGLVLMEVKVIQNNFGIQSSSLCIVNRVAMNIR